MKQEEIEKAVSDYSKSLEPIALENLKGEEIPYLLRGAFKEGLEFANKHWQEKTRWKSLITEPPTEFGENKQILINHINGGACIYPLYSNASVEHAIDMGFIEWKEID